MLIDGFIGQRNEALSTVSSSASKKRFREEGEAAGGVPMDGE